MSKLDKFGEWKNPGRVFITGASSGIGASYAKAFAEKGFDLVLLSRREDRLQVLANQLESDGRVHCEIISADLAEQEEIKKVIDEETFKVSIEDTFQYDNMILIEEYIQGREIECSVKGNQNPDVSQPGEISVVGGYDFYSFDAKYVDDTGAKLDMPANLEEGARRKIQDIALKAYKTLFCEDFARVDMFLKEDGEIFVNEINSIPGFTQISMFPQLWKLDGISYTDLISELIENAFEKFNRANRIKRDFDSSL